MKKKILAIILIVIAVVSLVFGVVMFTKGDLNRASGTMASKQVYGGDAYTGIQNASATTANNVQQANLILMDMNETIAFGFGAVLVVIGLLCCAFGVAFLLKKQEAAPVKETPAAFMPPYSTKDSD